MIPVIILAIENDDDREFMIRLYMDHKRLLYHKIYPIVRSKEDTEDLIQDLVVKLIDMIDFLRTFDHSALVSYLAEMAKNQALGFMDKAENRKTVSIPDPDYWDAHSESPDQVLIEKEWIDELHRVWPSLKEDTRTLLSMKYFLGMPDEQIAAEFHIKTASVRMRLTRARREVLKALEDLS